jgi:hemerythrin-like domain-containing protein
MGIQTLASALEREHREIDAGIEAFTSGSRAGDALSLSGAIQALRRHIYLEEEFLFPPLREDAPALSAAVQVMLREHGQMWDVLDPLEREIVTASRGETALTLCRQLVDMLSPHHLKEEEILYAAADDLLTRPAEVRLRGFLAYARLPEGWSCEMAKNSHSHASAVRLFNSRDC